MQKWLHRLLLHLWMVVRRPLTQLARVMTTKNRRLPFYLKSSDAWLCVDISNEAIKDDFLGRVFLHLIIVVFGILVVSDANKFLVAIGRGEDEGSYSQDIFCRDLGWIWWHAFELE